MEPTLRNTLLTVVGIVGIASFLIWLGFRLGYIDVVTRYGDVMIDEDGTSRPTPGYLTWVITEGNTATVIGSGQRIVEAGDFTREPVDMSEAPVDVPTEMLRLEKIIVPLSDHFQLVLASSTSPSKPPGFSLHVSRDDERTFSAEWFTTEQGGRAKKLQEKGELFVRFDTADGGTTIGRTEFSTDISFRVVRMSDLSRQSRTDPTWRVKILKGSYIDWSAGTAAAGS